MGNRYGMSQSKEAKSDAALTRALKKRGTMSELYVAAVAMFLSGFSTGGLMVGVLCGTIQRLFGLSKSLARSLLPRRKDDGKADGV